MYTKTIVLYTQKSVFIDYLETHILDLAPFLFVRDDTTSESRFIIMIILYIIKKQKNKHTKIFQKDIFYD